jgi:tetratricopeptide (TPR) repeat protein
MTRRSATGDDNAMPSSIQSRLNTDSYFRMGYFYQIEGDLHAAAECYIQSIEHNPNPEAHTFLGWVLSMMGEIDHAIEECKKALKLDPEFGNAWNDIGAYLTEKRELNRAIPYLKKACKTKNYDSREYPHYNLARVYLQKEMIIRAIRELRLSVKINPRFMPAKRLLETLEKQIH